MKPYHIKSKALNTWVDLESIQMIGNLVLFSDENMKKHHLPGGHFSITLAFQEKQKIIEASSRMPTLSASDPSYDEKFQKVRDERESLREAYIDLVNAWTALSSEPRSTEAKDTIIVI